MKKSSRRTRLDNCLKEVNLGTSSDYVRAKGNIWSSFTLKLIFTPTDLEPVSVWTYFHHNEFQQHLLKSGQRRLKMFELSFCTKLDNTLLDVSSKTEDLQSVASILYSSIVIPHLEEQVHLWSGPKKKMQINWLCAVTAQRPDLQVQ